MSYAATTPPRAEWDKTFGEGDYDEAWSVQQNQDGGFIVAGRTRSYGAGSDDVWLIKTDSQGNEQWNRTFGGPSEDYAYSAQETQDGGYIVVGNTKSFGAGNYDVWLIKTDFEGNEQWNRTFGGSEWDEAHSVKQTTDGGYIVVGKTISYGAGNYDVWLIKTDSQGTELWRKTFGGIGRDIAHSVQQTTDGGYIVAGETFTSLSGSNSTDFWLIKTDSEGNEQWSRIFGGSNTTDEAKFVQQTTDGGYIVAGSTYDVCGVGGYGIDTWLIKTDSEGRALWSKTFGGSSTDIACSLQQTKDGGYIVAGWTQSYGAGHSDAWLIRIDSQGNELWSGTFGGSNTDEAYSVQQTTDGGYIMAGRTFSYGAGICDVYLIKLAPEENLPPYASFTFSPTLPVADQEIIFDAGTSYDPDGTITQYLWDFGDGNTVTTTNTTTAHTYDPNGSYTIILTVTDNNGYTDSFNQTIKLGEREWIKIYFSSKDNYAYSVQQTTDGGYIMAGYQNYNAWLMKTDRWGMEIWSKTFCNTNKAYSVQQTTDGGYIVAGEKNHDAYLIKTDSKGKELWSRILLTGLSECATSVQEASDGGYIVAGNRSSGSGDAWLTKTDAWGKKLSFNTFWGLDYDRVYSVQETSDGGYIVAGYTKSYGAGQSDVWLIKTDSYGRDLWSKTFGGSRSEYAYSVQESSDGGYVVAGSTSSYGAGNSDAWLIKTDSQGNELWNRTFGGTGLEVARSVQQTTYGGYIVAGYTVTFGAGYLDAYLIKTDSEGNEVWSRTFGGSSRDEAYSVQQTQDGGYIVAGETESYGAGDSDVWLIKVAPDPITQIQELTSGYNPWALSLTPTEELTSHTLIADIPYARSILSWNQEFGKWFWATKIGENITGDNFPIEQTKGYFILTYQDSSFTLKGYQLTQPIIPNLTNGWNLIRIYDPQNTYSSYSFLRANSQAQLITTWDINTGEWIYAMRVFFGTITGQDFTLDPNKAYLIFCNQQSISKFKYLLMVQGVSIDILETPGPCGFHYLP